MAPDDLVNALETKLARPREVEDLGGADLDLAIP
jgi:hypothetical protein